MRTRFVTAVAVVFFALAAAIPVWADSFVVYSAPTPDYLSTTTLMAINGNVWDQVSSVSDGTLTVNFSSPLVIQQWWPWGAPGDVESLTPNALWARYGVCSSWPDCPTAGTLSFVLQGTVTTFGLEIAPDQFALQAFTVSFYNGEQLVGSISKVVDGNVGAQLFAASTDGIFTKVTINSPSDFAIADLRYIDPPSVPEPASLLLLGVGLLGYSTFVIWRQCR